MRQIISIFILLIMIISTSCRNSTSFNHVLISDTIRIKHDLKNIIITEGYRNYKNIEILNKVADYIKLQFLTISDSVNEQKFNYNGKQYKNIICSINTEKKERIVIGAHYDVCGDQDGADDNSSGVAGLLELARLLKNENLNYRIDFVAYTLEEPPFFGSNQMGSFIHAKYIHDNKIPILGMICLEMIGYYSEKPKSQDYPLGFLSWFYGDKANFIMVAQKFWNGKFGKDILKLMRKNNTIPTKSFKGPKSLAGLDFSDHRNYWYFGYSAVMITNTSFYRNSNYHMATDRIETLDLKKMALTIDELNLTIKQIK